MTDQYIAANGINIHYQEFGAGEPLILLHGGTANIEAWLGQIPTLEQHFRVIALDSRGHGKTINTSDELTYAQMADDVAAFIAALKLNKPLIMGYSDGGQIALELGMRYDTTGALVLGGTQHSFNDYYFNALQ